MGNRSQFSCHRGVGSTAARFLLLTVVLASVWPGMLAADETKPSSVPTAEQLQFFERSVRPLLVNRCYQCHSHDAKSIEGELRLDSRQAIRQGGASGPVVVPGDPDGSPLIRAVRYNDSLLQMPPGGRLPQREIEVLVEWVKMGAPDPRAADPGINHLPDARSKGKAKTADTAVDWWSFQPVRPVSMPQCRDAAWPASPMDGFVLSQLEQRKLRPAGQVDRRSLIRRATFDLTGLPPTPAEINAFSSDPSPDAFARVVDRLLASHAYGERWGRHWLDVVRYADTSGCNGDFPVPDAYRYRNYVIDSFNCDKPYDEFIREQIAGDLLLAGSEEDRLENIVATGYLAISRRFSSLGEEFHLTLDDTVDNVGKAVLGLTVSCARCHDHKFDPIPQSDYYALYGIFQSTTYSFPGTEIYRHTQHLTPLVSADRLENDLRTVLERMEQLDADIFATYSQMAEQDTGAEKNALRAKWQSLQGKRDEIVKTLPDFPRAYSASEGTATSTRIHIKGDPKNLGAEVPRGWLQILGGQQVSPGDSGSGRRQLAEWLTEPANPLTARVIVNRVWLHHFGRGLVGTPDDFGTRGDRPSHPELLDDLAQRFVAQGWSLKALHRQIMMSQVYQMACREDAAAYEVDPGNTALWTFNRRRLSAEEIRDATLAISGTLDASMGGGHPFPPEVAWRYTQHKPFVDDFPTMRRSVYLMQQRIRQQPYLAVFDGADTNAVTGLRQISTVAPQALFMLNSDFEHGQAGQFADRLAREASADSERIAAAFQLALARLPSDDEVREAVEYLAGMHRQLSEAGVADGDRARAAWSSYLRVLLSSNEFLFVD